MRPRRSMSEQEWLQIEKPIPMLAYVQSSIGDRPLRMFALALYRSYWEYLEGNDSRAIVTFAESMADNDLPKQQLKEMSELASEVYEAYEFNPLCRCIHFLLRTSMRFENKPFMEYWFGADNASEVLLFEIQDMENLTGHRVDFSYLCKIIRDIFGNPFRPVTFHTNWRTPTTQSLAQTMYDNRDFSAMPILGDALEEAGCDNDDILRHCQDKSEHVRGCWVVDLVTDRN